MKRIHLHLDATIAIIVVFLLSFGMNFYQYYQYSDLLNAHVELQVNALRMEYSVSFMKASLDKCENNCVTE